MMEGKKMEEKNKILAKDEEMEEVSGGGCWFNARFVAPDGHDVGCEVQWYRVQFSDLEFCKKFPKICPIDGGPHDLSGRHYNGNGSSYYECAKCGHFLEKDGSYHDGWGVLVE